jgi:hypothetical protein
MHVLNIDRDHWGSKTVSLLERRRSADERLDLPIGLLIVILLSSGLWLLIAMAVDWLF